MLPYTLRQQVKTSGTGSNSGRFNKATWGQISSFLELSTEFNYLEKQKYDLVKQNQKVLRFVHKDIRNSKHKHEKVSCFN